MHDINPLLTQRVRFTPPHEQPELERRVGWYFTEHNKSNTSALYTVLAAFFKQRTISITENPEPNTFAANVLHATSILEKEQLIARTGTTHNDLIEYAPTDAAFELFGDIVVREPLQREGALLVERKPWRTTNPPTVATTAELAAMEKNLKKTNDFLASFRITIDPFSGFESLYGKPFGERKRATAVDFELMPPTAQLSRMFARDGHGRFYQRAAHAYWMQPSALREHIRLGNTGSTEIDFTANTINVACAMSGRPNKAADPYCLILQHLGAGPAARSSLKKLIMPAMAARSDGEYRAFIRGPRHYEALTNLRAAGVNPARVRQALLQTYPQLDGMLDKRLSNRVMYHESRIMERVLDAARTAGVPVLPIHDCVIGPYTETDRLAEFMTTSFRTEFPNAPVFIDIPESPYRTS